MRDAVELPKSPVRTEPSVQSSDLYTNGAKHNTIKNRSLNPFYFDIRDGTIYHIKRFGTRKKRRHVSPVWVSVLTGTASASTMKGLGQPIVEREDLISLAVLPRMST